MESCAAALRYAARSLRKSPVYATAVVLSLALGVGVNVSMFSIIDAVLLRPLPFARADELYVIGLSDRDGTTWRASPSYVESWLATHSPPAPIGEIEPYSGPVRVAGATEYVNGAQATPDLIEVLGLSPEHGRWFVKDDLLPGSPRAMVISHEFWASQFGLDPDVLGRKVRLFDQQWTVVGVMPPRMAAPFAAPFWIPGEKFDGRLIVRLANDGSRAKVMTLPIRQPSTRARRPTVTHPALIGLREHLYGAARPTLRLLIAAATLLLIVSCFNIANLALARVVERQHAMSVRAALGASRVSLASGVITENLLLALAGD